MRQEVDLLINYPRTKRKVNARGQQKTKSDQELARKFGKEFFDGDRRNGYGGFSYNPRFWQPVIPTFKEHFKLDSGSSVLDVGCAKGFMLYDFVQLIPGINVEGIDISDYAIANAVEEIKPFVGVANAKHLPYEDNSFDIIISINTIHNLEREDCAEALREIQRVSRQGAYVTVDAYRTDEERDRMMAWNLTAQTIMSVDEWKTFFDAAGYQGDFYWFIP